MQEYFNKINPCLKSSILKSLWFQNDFDLVLLTNTAIGIVQIQVDSSGKQLSLGMA